MNHWFLQIEGMSPNQSKFSLVPILFVCWLLSACNWSQDPCNAHSDLVEGECACIDGYAYPACDQTLEEIFGNEMVLDTVLESTIPKRWSDLEIFYLTASYPRRILLREQNFQREIYFKIDEYHRTYFDHFEFYPQTNSYLDTLGAWHTTGMFGRLTYDVTRRTFEICNFDPLWKVVYRTP